MRRCRRAYCFTSETRSFTQCPDGRGTQSGHASRDPLPDPPERTDGLRVSSCAWVATAQASQRLASACGPEMPQIPSEILFDRSPAAFISIIYPPVIASLTSDDGQQPAEACTPVEIRWHVHVVGSTPLGSDTIHAAASTRSYETSRATRSRRALPA